MSNALAVQVLSVPFEEALAAFLGAINASLKARANAEGSNLAWSEKEDGSDVPEGKVAYFRPVAVQFGPKFVRVISRNGGPNAASVYCFVDKASGDIYKAAGWKAPAKGIRGNIRNMDKILLADLSSTGWLYR